MAAICESSIHLCRVRVTRLNELGSPTAGPNNAYVTDKPMMLNVTPQIEAGVDRTLVGGCDCVVASYRGFDKLKRFDLELDLAQVEPALMEMLIGATAIVEGGKVAGNWWPSQLSCSQPAQPNVCFEAWSDSWTDDHQASAPIQYIHWIWPSTHWQIAAFSLQNDFMTPKLTGYSRGNTNWGLGIYGDLPEAAQPLGGYFYTSILPTSFCDYITEGLT